MIARIWKGVVRRTDADEYADYIRETGFNDYAETGGNRGAWMLRRDEAERTEFITFSLWESVEAIRAFAGEDIEAAVYYPEDERYLIEREATVSHYEVVDHAQPRLTPYHRHGYTDLQKGWVSLTSIAQHRFRSDPSAAPTPCRPRSQAGLHR